MIPHLVGFVLCFLSIILNGYMVVPVTLNNSRCGLYSRYRYIRDHRLELVPLQQLAQTLKEIFTSNCHIWYTFTHNHNMLRY